MKSKTSCFNTGIAKNLIIRFWPLWLGYFLVMLLFPLTLYSRLRAFNPATDMTPGLDYMLGSMTDIALILSLIVGVLAAMAVFGFLYQPRSCGLLNSLPVTRTGLFFTACLSGAGMLLAVDLLTLGITALLCLSGYLSMSTVLGFFSALIFSKTFFYGFAVFCAMLTGNLLILPAVYFVLNFAAIVFERSVMELLGHLVYGLRAYVVRLSFLSPFIYMGKRLGVHYTQWPDQVEISGIPATALYALIGIVFAVIAWRLFLRRNMETAGDTVAIRVLKPLFQYCMCFGCAVVFAIAVYSIADLRLSGKPAAIVLLLLLLIGAFIGYFGARMLIEKSFRVFHRGWKAFAVCAAVIVLFLGAFEYDLFGVERYVPELQDVRMVLFNGVELKEPENIDQVLALQRSLIAHKDRYENGLGFDGEYMSVDGTGRTISRNAEITYSLKSGKTVTRLYAVQGREAEIADPDSDLMTLEAVQNCREALEWRCTLKYPLTAEHVVTASIDFMAPDKDGIRSYNESVMLTPEEVRDFWENGVLPDLAEGHIARRTVCDTDRGWQYTDTQLLLCLVADREAYQRSGGNVYEQSWINVQIATDSVHCLDWIEARTGIRPAATDSSYDNAAYGVG